MVAVDSTAVAIAAGLGAEAFMAEVDLAVVAGGNGD
jgi:hypothetical protein